MKILFYISTIRGGGAAHVMVNLANQFQKKKVQVIFVTNFTCDKEYALDSSIKRLSLEKYEPNKKYIIKNLNRIVKLRRSIKDYKPDIVISFMHENDIRAFIATRGINCKLLLSVRTNPERLYSNKRKALFAKFIYGHADAIVFQTGDAQAWFGNVKAKTKVIYNQVAPEFYGVSRDLNSASGIVTFGRFIKEKNHKLLICSFAKIANMIDDNLYIYGDGELRNEYESLINSLSMNGRVFLPGNVTDVEHVLEKSRLFVLSSNQEGMPNSLMEAMAVGVPCISTDCPCGGPRMLLEDNQAGLLVSVGSDSELSESILKIIDDEKLASKLSNGAKKKAESFHPEKVFKEWNDFIKIVANS